MLNPLKKSGFFPDVLLLNKFIIAKYIKKSKTRGMNQYLNHLQGKLMASTEPLCHLFGINSKKLSKEENALLEADLLALICHELEEIYRLRQKDYFLLMKFTLGKENDMLETNLVRLIIKDILQTGEYTLEGIALYTDTHEDIIHELASGINVHPTVKPFRKIIELHRSVRPEIYRSMRKKLISDI